MKNSNLPHRVLCIGCNTKFTRSINIEQTNENTKKAFLQREMGFIEFSDELNLNIEPNSMIVYAQMVCHTCAKCFAELVFAKKVADMVKKSVSPSRSPGFEKKNKWIEKFHNMLIWILQTQVRFQHYYKLDDRVTSPEALHFRRQLLKVAADLQLDVGQTIKNPFQASFSSHAEEFKSPFVKSEKPAEKILAPAGKKVQGLRKRTQVYWNGRNTI